jgi:hypothetical protein
MYELKTSFFGWFPLAAVSLAPGVFIAEHAPSSITTSTIDNFFIPFLLISFWLAALCGDLIGTPATGISSGCRRKQHSIRI